jgi:hypothetical protein
MMYFNTLAMTQEEHIRPVESLCKAGDSGQPYASARFGTGLNNDLIYGTSDQFMNLRVTSEMPWFCVETLLGSWLLGELLSLIRTLSFHHTLDPELFRDSFWGNEHSLRKEVFRTIGI